MSACANGTTSLLMTPTKTRLDESLALSSCTSSSPPTRGSDFKGDFKGTDAAANGQRNLMDVETRLELGSNCVCNQPFSSLVLPRHPSCVTALQSRTLDCPHHQAYLLRNPPSPFCRHQLVRDLDSDVRLAMATVDLLQISEGEKRRNKCQAMISYPPGMRSPAGKTLKGKDDLVTAPVAYA